MSIYLAESFDGVATASQLNGNFVSGARWGSFDASFSLSSTNQRTGQNLEATGVNCGPAISLAGTTFNDVAVQNKEIYVGCAFRTPSLATSSTGLLGFLGSNGVPMNSLLFNTNGSVSATRRNVVAVNSLGGFITTNTWHYVEMYVKRADTNGRIVVRVDDVIAIDFTGDTYDQAGTAPTNNPHLVLGRAHHQTGEYHTTTGAKWDDLYIVSVDGVGHNGFCGTSYVPCLRPNANGAESDWVGSDGNSTDNYQLIDEQGTTDSDYVEATNNGDRDLYQHESYDVPAGQTILSVQMNARAAYLSTPRDLGFVAKLSGGTEEIKEHVLSNSLWWRWKNFETKPGGGAWSETDYNDAEFGIEQAAV